MSLTERRTMTPRAPALMAYVQSHAVVTATEAAAALDWEASNATKYLRDWCEQGLLIREPRIKGGPFRYRMRLPDEARQRPVCRVQIPDSPPQPVEVVAQRLASLLTGTRAALDGPCSADAIRLLAIEACGVASRVFQWEGRSAKKLALDELTEALWGMVLGHGDEPVRAALTRLEEG
jgi:hypothetical protein